MKFYVYKLIDPRNDKVFYIGKGKGRRSKYHVMRIRNGKLTNNNRKLFNKITSILNEGFSDVVYAYEYFDTEDDAYDREKELIEMYGLQNLCNITMGGLGGNTGGKGGVKKGNVPWNKGVPMSDTLRNKIRDTKIKYFEENPHKRVNKGTFKAGKHHTHFGTKQSIDTINKRIETSISRNVYDRVSNKLRNNTNARTASIVVKNKNHQIIGSFNSIKEAAIAVNVPRYIIDNILAGNQKQTKGLYFEYEKD